MANPRYTVSDKPIPVAELVATLTDGTKIKRRVPRMRACNEKDEKGKLCAGHLKRWYFFGDEVKKKFGADPSHRFQEPLQRLQDWGFATIEGDQIVLNREALLQVDRLLHEFFLPEHRHARYA